MFCAFTARIPACGLTFAQKIICLTVYNTASKSAFCKDRYFFGQHEKINLIDLIYVVSYIHTCPFVGYWFYFVNTVHIIRLTGALFTSYFQCMIRSFNSFAFDLTGTYFLLFFHSCSSWICMRCWWRASSTSTPPSPLSCSLTCNRRRTLSLTMLTLWCWPHRSINSLFLPDLDLDIYYFLLPSSIPRSFLSPVSSCELSGEQIPTLYIYLPVSVYLFFYTVLCHFMHSFCAHTGFFPMRGKYRYRSPRYKAFYVWISHLIPNVESE